MQTTLSNTEVRVVKSTKKSLYTRWEDGGQLVEVVEKQLEGRVRVLREYTLHGGNSEPVQKFGTTTSLLAHVSNRVMSHARYFKLRSLSYEIVGGGSILELVSTSVQPLFDICVPRVEVLPRGIDLNRRGIEVRRILHKCYGSKIKRSGYDIEEVLQEVYLKLIKANNGSNPYDPAKSAFSHYVHMACGSLLMNFHKKEERRNSRVVVGLDQVVGEIDVGRQVRDMDLNVDTELRHQMAVTSLSSYVGSEVEGRVVELLGEGHKRRDLSKILNIEPLEVGKILKRVRKKARIWSHI